jgi:hypothetical protein
VTRYLIADPEFLGDWTFGLKLHDTDQEQADYHANWTTRQGGHTLVEGGEIVIHLSKETPELSVVAHEATHAVLWALDRERSDAGTKKPTITLFGHPEVIASRVGNLTAIIWLAYLDN